MSDIIKGQEAVCPDGLGRVVDFGDDWIKVKTYYNNRGCHWARHNVTLISPFTDKDLHKEDKMR